MNRRPELRPDVAVHGLFVVFGFVIAAFFPFFSIYLHGRGLSADQIGVVIAATAFARIIGNPIWGHYADTRTGRLTAFQIGTIGAGAAAAAMNLVDGLAAITIVASIVAAFWVATVLVSVLFGYGHYYKGPTGIIDSGVAGLILGTAYIVSGRNLWACILAHGFIDTVGVTFAFFGWAD